MRAETETAVQAPAAVGGTLLGWDTFRARLGSYVIRTVLHVLRAVKPVVGFFKHVHVLRRDDIVDVLRRSGEFSVAVYDINMRSAMGPFLLGMEDTEEYRRDRRAIADAIRPTDMKRVAALTAGIAGTLVGEQAPEGKLNLVPIVKRTLVGVLEDYYGLAPIGAGADDRAAAELAFMRKFEAVSYFVFVPPNFVRPDLRMAGIRAGREIYQHVLGLAEARAADPDEPDNILGRLVAMTRDTQRAGFDTDAAVRTLIGTSSGTLVPTMRQTLAALDRLFDLPHDEFAFVTDAARSALQAQKQGDDEAAAAADARLWKYLREASRFEPFPGILFRHCERTAEVGAPTGRRRIVEGGRTVVCWIQSASFDARVVPDPYRFNADRGEEQYLLFGHGQHACLGARPDAFLVRVLMTEIAKPVLALEGLRRAPGRLGYIRNGHRRAVPDVYSPESFLIDVSV